jgi:hypothetical protein
VRRRSRERDCSVRDDYCSFKSLFKCPTNFIYGERSEKEHENLVKHIFPQLIASDFQLSVKRTKNCSQIARALIPAVFAGRLPDTACLEESMAELMVE